MRPTIRMRLALWSAGLLVGSTAIVLATSWWLLGDHLDRTLPDAYADDVLERLAGQYGLAVVGVGLVALGLGWFVAGRALSPLRTMATTARRVSEERLAERVDHAGPEDELSELAGSMNAMLDRLQAAVEGQRRFVANASHELRTPLTAIRTETEVTLADPDATVEDLRETARGVIETTERMDALLDGLLVLASSAAPPARSDDVDLSMLARRVERQARREADATGVVLNSELQPARVRGHEALLERLVANLVENAIRHNRAGGSAGMSVRTVNGSVLVRVENDGDPIPPDALARLAEPFERLDRAARRRGSGLGLSIVRAVAEAEGGALHLAARDGGGLVAEVTLPSAALTPS